MTAREAALTPAERDAEREEQQGVERLLAGLRAVLEVVGKRRGVSGSMPCPCCEGELRYSVSGYNGHLRAKCDSPGCIEFMQ